MQLSRRWKAGLGIVSISVGIYYFLLPQKLFSDPYSTVLLDRKAHLLGASIASDGQWRFPEASELPVKFKEAIILFEDKRFYRHWGIDFLSLGRATRQNIQARKIVSGGSTLTMQVIRLARKNKARTIFEKLIELVLATRLEFRYSKEEILLLHASHAPFGGNVVGLEAACWRYFGRSTAELSWAEAALLAVLPNNPSLIHPGRNRTVLQQKRNHLLERLASKGLLDSLSLELAKAEPLPQAPIPLPQLAPHLLAKVMKDGHAQQKLITTIEVSKQERCNQILRDHHDRLAANRIFNGAILVAEVKTGNVIAYVGNMQTGREHQEQVDIIQSPRSTGSILKPFLFAAMLKEGKMLPTTLQPDVPTFINGFVPKNFSKSYDGAVPADQALIRSLNIPAVHELREYRYEKFHTLLTDLGLTTLHQPPDHYGLTLILGGAEGTLWDITGAYASMGRLLTNYFERPGKNKYAEKDIHPITYFPQIDSTGELASNSALSAGSIYLTFEVLKNLYRPGEETGWQHFNSTKRIAWKTGTSHGLRDGWAVGINPEYVVGVWVGNADGEGRPGLTGTEAAAPILFDVFSSLPGENKWFQPPNSELVSIAVCSKSGQRATKLCDGADTLQVVTAGLQSAPCSYHKQIHLTQDAKFQVHGDCEAINKMITKSWFVLPPVQEFYFKQKNISYKPQPPFRRDCLNPSLLSSLDLIYPKLNAAIFLPRQMDGSPGQVIFEAVHRNALATIFWHLDGSFVGSTQKTHKIAFLPTQGPHLLTLVDDRGEILERAFRIY